MGVVRKGSWLAVVLLGSCATVAHAMPYVQARPATRAEQATAMRIARDYWRANAPAGLARDGLPPCGTPRISWDRSPAADSYAAEAYVDGSCRIVFNSAFWYWPLPTRQANTLVGGDTWPSFCTAMAHEWGHLILGPTYFAAVNPTDPGHSPDPHSLMYAFEVHDLPVCTQTPDPASSTRTASVVLRRGAAFH
jgi:hypothetical protein